MAHWWRILEFRCSGPLEAGTMSRKPSAQRGARPKQSSLGQFSDDLATAISFPENVRVHAVIVAELELRDIETEILAADLVACADNATLQDASEALDGCWCGPRRQRLAGAVVD